MIADDEHLHKPRGRLVYHIELVGLLGACSLGKNAAAEMMVRDILPLDELVRQITLPELPQQLRANYLCVLREAYLETERANKEVGAHPALMGFLGTLRASIEDLVEALVEPGANLLEDEGQLQAASYVVWEVLPTLQLYYKNHYVAPSPAEQAKATAQQQQQQQQAHAEHPAEDDDDEPYVSAAQFGEELAQLVMLLGQEAAGLEAVIPPRAVIECLEAMASSGLCTMTAPSATGNPALSNLGGTVKDAQGFGAGAGAVAAELSDDGAHSDGPEIAGDFPLLRRGSGALAGATADGHAMAEEPHPQETLREFFEVFAEISGVEAESSGLVAVFTKGIDDDGSDGDGKKNKGEESIGEKRTRNMVEQLVGSRARSPAEGEAIDLARTATSLRVLTAILAEVPDGEENAEKMRSRQRMLTKMGGARLALMMASSEVRYCST